MMSNHRDGDMRVMAVLPGMWARGAEICTLNLLTGLLTMGYKNLYFHAALRQAVPAEMELHLLPRFQEVATVSYGIHGAKPGMAGPLTEAMKLASPNILLYSFDPSLPAYIPWAKSVLVVHGIAKNDFEAYNAEHTDAVVCVSHYAANIATQYGIPKEKLYIIPNGVPKTRGSSRRTELSIPQDAWVWCFVGGLTRLKRPQLLIAALAQRQEMDEYAIFAGAVDGGMFLEEYAETLGVQDRCRFLGHTDGVADVYSTSDCLVITSERESMPLTMLEAMSASVPVVANSVGGIPEVLKDDFSVLFTDESGEAGLNEALSTIRQKKRDAPVFDSVEGYAYDCWKTSYTLPIMTSAYHRLFEKLLGE